MIGVCRSYKTVQRKLRHPWSADAADHLPNNVERDETADPND